MITLFSIPSVCHRKQGHQHGRVLSVQGTQRAVPISIGPGGRHHQRLQGSAAGRREGAGEGGGRGGSHLRGHRRQPPVVSILLDGHLQRATLLARRPRSRCHPGGLWQARWKRVLEGEELVGHRLGTKGIHLDVEEQQEPMWHCLDGQLPRYLISYLVPRWHKALDGFKWVVVVVVHNYCGLFP